MKNRIAVVTATRAEYGILYPLIKNIESDESLELCLIVTGTHLSDKFGYTIDEIRKDGFEIYKEIPILEEGNTQRDVSVTMANAITGFAQFFEECRIDMLIILGDRTEMLGVACAAMNALVPIAHISGGSITEGAVDDCVRHCLTKMSHFHFTTTEPYRRRVIQMGESPECVINAGSLAVENIFKASLLTEEEIRNFIGISSKNKFALVTFHPVTRDDDSGLSQVRELCDAMLSVKEIYYVLTGSNADVRGNEVNDMLERLAEENDKIIYFKSLGKTRYLSALKYAAFVLGNSSSGITEAPILGTPTVNVGDRQNGRIMTDTIINTDADKNSIIDAINKALQVEHKCTDIYGKGDTSSIILNSIKNGLHNGINLKKKFYDIKFVEE